MQVIGTSYKAKVLAAVCGCLGSILLAVGAAAGTELGDAPDLHGAKWIWSSKAAAAADGNDVCLFRKTFTLAAKPRQATLVLTLDNGFDLYVNGHYLAGEGGSAGTAWRSAERFRIEPYLLQGANVIAIRGENTGGPGGLLLAARIQLVDDEEVTIVSDDSWLTAATALRGWTESDHNDSQWSQAVVLGKMGVAPWGSLKVPGELSKLKQRSDALAVFSEPGADYSWPAGVVFVADKAPLNSVPNAPQAKWPIDGSRAFFEHDTPTPSALGHSLYSLVPARPETEPHLLVDAGKGLIGSPTCSYDGREIIFTMAPAGEKYFKLFRIEADGGGLRRLTKGPWHDYDPAVLPDGRIVFASTRIGSRDEYHGNTARSLFALSADRREIRPLTYHIVGDSEPAVMADGRIAFVRADNFFQRAKVETHIHAIHPDGTSGEVLIGPHRGKIVYDRPTAAEEQSLWLRNYGFGSPAPLPDGRVACLSYMGPIVSPLPGTNASSGGGAWDKVPLPSNVSLFDISPLPDGRLLCSTKQRGMLGILDPQSGKVVLLYKTDQSDPHSVTYLGPRPKPTAIAPTVKPSAGKPHERSGFLLCQNIFATKQRDGDWDRVKAVRLLMGAPFTTRSAHHPYDHIGVEGIELGTVPLAPDGSFHVRVPADRALAIQAVDAEGRAVVNELSWIYVRPGEHRSCTGCHNSRQDAPGPGGVMAARRPPVDLMPRGTPHRFRANNAANGGVLNLQFDRFREVASIDLYEQPVVPAGYDTTTLPLGRPAAVGRLCELLATGSTPEQVSACQRLALFRDHAAVPFLVNALSSHDASVRVNASLALAACGNRAAVAPLVEALLDRAPAAAQAAKIALEHLTGHIEKYNTYGDMLMRIDGQKRWRTWRAGTDWKAIEQQLIARIGSQNLAAAHQAIEALGHVGTQPATTALRQFIESKQTVSLIARLAAIRAVGHLHDDKAVPLLAKILEQNIEQTPVDPSQNHEFGWAQGPVHLAGAAAEALGWIGGKEAERHLVEAFGQLGPFWYYSFRSGDHEWLKGCHSSIPHYRIAEALDALGSRVELPVVAGLLRSVPMDPDRGLLYENDVYETVVARVIHRSGVAPGVIETCLAVLGDADAKPVEELKEAATASPPAVSVGTLSPEARAAQLLSVVSLQPEDAARIRAALERYRAQEPSRKRSWVCFFLARTLGKLKDTAAAPVLLGALQQDPTEASFGIPAPPNVFLHEAMTPLYRAAAADALGRIGTPEATPVLLSVVADFDNAMDVRQAAARALAGTAQLDSLPQLEKLAENYPEVATQRTLLGTCSVLRSHRDKTVGVAR